MFTYDKLKIQLLNTNCSEKQNKILVHQQIQHHNEAEEALNSKICDISTFSKNQYILAFDLQQCLPTSSFDSSVTFYNCGPLILLCTILELLLHQTIFGMKL